jgi:hypothetical protein
MRGQDKRSAKCVLRLLSFYPYFLLSFFFLIHTLIVFCLVYFLSGVRLEAPRF